MAPKKITKKNTNLFSLSKAEFLSGQNLEKMPHLSTNTPEIFSANDKILNTNEIFKIKKEGLTWKKQSLNIFPPLSVFPESCSDNDDNNTTTTNSYPVTPTTLAPSPVSFQHFDDINNNITHSFNHQNETNRLITPPLDKEQITKSKRRKRTREEYLAKFKLPVNGIATRTRNRTQNTVPVEQHGNEESIRNQDTLIYFRERAAPIPELCSDAYKYINNKPIKKLLCLRSSDPNRIDTVNPGNVDAHVSDRLNNNNNIDQTAASSSKNPNYPIPISKEEVGKKWSTNDRKIFLATYLCNGKDFTSIAQKTGKKSSEVVEYYYMFKHNQDFRAAKEIVRENHAYEEYLGSIETEIKSFEKMAQSYAPKFAGKKKGVPGRPKRSNGKPKSKK